MLFEFDPPKQYYDFVTELGYDLIGACDYLLNCPARRNLPYEWTNQIKNIKENPWEYDSLQHYFRKLQKLTPNQWERMHREDLKKNEALIKATTVKAL